MLTIINAEEYGAWASAKGLDGNPSGLDFELRSATKRIQNHCGREFVTTAQETRVYMGDGGYTLLIDDAIEVNSVMLYNSVIPCSGFPLGSKPIMEMRQTLNSMDYTYSGFRYLYGYPYAVTATFGYAASPDDLPEDLKEACLYMTASRVLMSTPLQNSTDFINQTTVVNVTVKYDNMGMLPLIQQFEKMGMEKLEPYVRMEFPVT